MVLSFSHTAAASHRNMDDAARLIGTPLNVADSSA